MNRSEVLLFETIPVSLRSAWDMRRAWRPTWESPISPSSSALGTSAATESTTTMSTAPERIRISVISSACSPLSGWETIRLSTSHAELAGVFGVERMLGVDEGGDAAQALGLGDHVKREGRLAGRFGAEDLDHAAAGDAPDAQRVVDREGGRRDHRNVLNAGGRRAS